MARDGEHAWRRATGLCHRRSGLSYVVLAADHDQPLVLEEAAAEVFEALDEPRTADELLAGLSVDSGLPEGEVRPHLESALALLAEAGVITTV